MNETKIEDMIDYNNANFGQIENVLTIFKAYNQANIEQDTAWSIWPEWELCLTAIDSDIWFEDDDDSGSGRSAGSCASSLGFARPPTRFHFWFLLYIPPHGRPIWSLGGAPGVGVPIPNTP